MSDRSIEEIVRTQALRAKEAESELSRLSPEKKNRILLAMADRLIAEQSEILEANSIDISDAKRSSLSPALIDRLLLNEKRIEGMSRNLLTLANFPDPVGTLLSEKELPNGLIVKKIRVPLGVVGIVYESRPNVTAEATGICLRSSNAVLLRGGSEALRSNETIARILQAAGEDYGLPKDAIQLVSSSDRNAIYALAKLEGLIDLLILRGGESLIRSVVEVARVPVMKHYQGICHVFVDESAEAEMAIRICENAKCQRPGTCNAMETLLIHRDAAERLLPAIATNLQNRGVELRGDSESRRIVPDMKEAHETDWSTEYLDLILSIKVVENLEAAIRHIRSYGSKHSESIVTNSELAKDRFLSEVDSAVVYVNASTRFTDGGEFRMGGEIGISTDKLHARGPVGAEELTTYKYVVLGSGQIRE